MVGGSTYKYVVQVNGKFDKSSARGIVFTTTQDSTVTVVAASKGGSANKISIGKYEKGKLTTPLKEETLSKTKIINIQ